MRKGGTLLVRACCKNGELVLDVEHDGAMRVADKERIRQMLEDTSTDGTRVGLRNVSQRMRLLYGNHGKITVGETGRGTILAQVRIPLNSNCL